MKKIIGLLFLCIAIICPVFGDSSIIKIVTEEWEEVTNHDGTGLYFDIFRAVFEEMGYTLDITLMPYAQAVKQVQNGKADIALGTYLDEVEGVYYPELHFGGDDISVVYENNSINWEGENSLKDQKISWIRGYVYNEYFDIPMRPVKVDSTQQGINMVLKKRALMHMDNGYDIFFTLEEMDLIDQFTISHVKFMNLYPCFINNGFGVELMELYDKRMAELVADGTILNLYIEYEYEDDYNL